MRATSRFVMTTGKLMDLGADWAKRPGDAEALTAGYIFYRASLSTKDFASYIETIRGKVSRNTVYRRINQFTTAAKRIEAEHPERAGNLEALLDAAKQQLNGGKK